MYMYFKDKAAQRALACDYTAKLSTFTVFL